jgi:cell division cycle 14
MYFVDGSTPSPDIVKRFLHIIGSGDIVALHCRAGLGRTFIFWAVSEPSV